MPELSPVSPKKGLLDFVDGLMKTNPNFCEHDICQLEPEFSLDGAKVKIRWRNTATGTYMKDAIVRGVKGSFCKLGAGGNLERAKLGLPPDGAKYAQPSIDLARYELNLFLKDKEIIETMNRFPRALWTFIYDNFEVLKKHAGRKWVLGKEKPASYEDFERVVQVNVGKWFSPLLAKPDEFFNPSDDPEGVHVVKVKSKVTRLLNPGEEDPSVASTHDLTSRAAKLVEALPAHSSTGRKYGMRVIPQTDYLQRPLDPNLIERMNSSSQKYWMMVTLALPWDLNLGSDNVMLMPKFQLSDIAYLYTEKELKRMLDGKRKVNLVIDFPETESEEEEEPSPSFTQETKRARKDSEEKDDKVLPTFTIEDE